MAVDASDEHHANDDESEEPGALGELKYVKWEVFRLKDEPRLDEEWLEARLKRDPALLGLGPLEVKDQQRRQPTGGRFDLLLTDRDSERETRYEVEIQLGATDPDHIMRTIEYWDVERKRFPQYDHVAVIVAEDITSRFFNLISLFSGCISLIAIQVTAAKRENEVTLIFTRVLDLLEFGTDTEDAGRETHRVWYEQKKPDSLALVHELFSIIQEFDPDVSLNYTQAYIGLRRREQRANWVMMRLAGRHVVIQVKLPFSEDLRTTLNNAGLDVIGWYPRDGGRFHVRVTRETLDEPAQRAALRDLLRTAHRHWMP